MAVFSIYILILLAIAAAIILITRLAFTMFLADIMILKSADGLVLSQIYTQVHLIALLD